MNEAPDWTNIFSFNLHSSACEIKQFVFPNNNKISPTYVWETLKAYFCNYQYGCKYE